MSHDIISYQAGSLTYVLLGGVMFVDFVFSDYIVVGGGYWRPNFLMTVVRCWWQITSPRLRASYQHQISVTNITFWRIMMLVAHFTAMQKKCYQHTFFATNIKSPT